MTAWRWNEDVMKLNQWPLVQFQQACLLMLPIDRRENNTLGISHKYSSPIGQQSSSWDHVAINNQHVEQQLELHMQMRLWLSTAGLYCQGHRLWFKVKHDLCVVLWLGLVSRLTASRTWTAQTTEANIDAAHGIVWTISSFFINCFDPLFSQTNSTLISIHTCSLHASFQRKVHDLGWVLVTP